VKRLPVLFSLVLVSFTGSGQSYQFFNFGLSEGLCDKFAYTINQDPQGFLWVGTTQGLCRFDGKQFDQEFRGDSLPSSIAFTSLLDSRGRLWFGHENGSLSLLEDGSFRLIIPREGLRSTIQDLLEDRNGNILALMQQGVIMSVNPALETVYIGGNSADQSNPFSGKILNSFEMTPAGDLLVGTNDGLGIYRYDPELETYIHTGDISDFQYLVVQEIAASERENEFWIGTEDEGLFLLKGSGFDPGGYSVEKIGEQQGLSYARIGTIVFDGPKRVWITDYGVGIHRIELDQEGKPGNSVLFNTENGIPNPYINHIFIDEEGNQWFSSQGNGIAVLRDQAFTFFDLWEDERSTDITAVCSGGGNLWFGGISKLACYHDGSSDHVTYLGTSNGLPDDRVTALHLDPAGNLYIGTGKSGLHLLRRDAPRIVPLVLSGNSLENNINAIDGFRDSIFVATNNGVYSINLATGKRTSFSTANGLPHNKVNDILVDEEGTAWIATLTSGLVGIRSEKEIVQVILEGKPKLEFLSLARDKSGVIWAGTYGDGVFKFNNDTLRWFHEIEGLLSDYTYAIGIDPKGYVWVGHRQGLSRIDPEKEFIRTFGKESGFTSDISPNAVATDEMGRLLFGTSGGLIMYDAYQAKEDSIPPRLSLKSVVISDTPYDPSSEIRLRYDKYRVRIDFVGINLSNPEQVTYQFKLDGYEDEWSDVSDVSYAFYGRVEDGDYTFMLRACDGNGNCSPEPLRLDISVRIPVWKAWWFILSSVILVLALIFAIFKIRERNQKAIQEYLQRQLDERTREVVLQKEEIEVKNRDITDSINYAQRIQASILPPIKKLHDTFSGSFVFYQPRDIVSGDFYWYEHVGENRFMIVCADSTGHGVPGAFMSMIGTTLIKDICLRAGIRKPSEVLYTLDKEIRESLNQNIEATGSNDGMDIIVGEFDLKTLKFIVSSAMRPLIIYSGNEQIYLKGSRSSVGGQQDEEQVEKEFTDQVFQLKKGDTLYMFSDGYPDQFGGPLGRKFKMVRLKNLLRDIHEKPMDEQYNYIKSNFFLWKEDLEQVDDVLFMGIRL
jgi:ligand-binding sensor domain-containing protein/serine phosphatase RsbU (regulator of sigma subunit)